MECEKLIVNDYRMEEEIIIAAETAIIERKEATGIIIYTNCFVLFKAAFSFYFLCWKKQFCVVSKSKYLSKFHFGKVYHITVKQAWSSKHRQRAIM
jgi:hypothetical protein